MREFKQNTWTLIKRLSLGLALIVPGFYQGHAQAQNVTLTFSGTIQNPICLVRVSNGAGNPVMNTGAAATTLPLSSLPYSEVYSAAQGTLIGTSTLFKVDVIDQAGSSCPNTNLFQVTLLAAVVGDVKTISGNTVLTSSSNQQVGLLISLKKDATTATYTPLTSLPTATSMTERLQNNSNLAGLGARAQNTGSFEYSVQPMKLVAANTPFTPGSYGGQLTVQATFY